MLEQFERVLVFQMDTMIYRKGIEEYYKYDYIGVPLDPKNNSNLFELYPAIKYNPG